MIRLAGCAAAAMAVVAAHRQQRLQVMPSCQQMLQQEGLLKQQTRLEGPVSPLEEQVLSSSADYAAVAQQEADAEVFHVLTYTGSPSILLRLIPKSSIQTRLQS